MMTARVVVASSAPPTPMPARAAMSWAESWAKPPRRPGAEQHQSEHQQPLAAVAVGELPAVSSSPDCTSA
ncbi:hypothetical protein GLX30_34390 [Streptomyces sp. Tu 2975]|uniref:hypothetical protein n=1 Tax=Streptomyces sp. Tu 2975 TaxID=2676871 RepID=UPI001357B884|nr:hypothetical protein GLX30_34390 [Streptomyces sp. Tu 2975]